MCSLMDEMIDVFGTVDFHIGQDEAFEIGKCDRCKGLPVEVICRLAQCVARSLVGPWCHHVDVG